MDFLFLFFKIACLKENEKEKKIGQPQILFWVRYQTM